MAVYALVDCNNFYVSCERLFQPNLNHRPVVVLSNNDGCVVARSNEVKALEVPMGVPYFKVESLIREHDVSVFSSNYPLYADISERIMSVLRSRCACVEVYSIDEAFLRLDDMSDELCELFCFQLSRQLFKWIGIPVSIGLGRTKTLAKAANEIAKTRGCPVFSVLDDTQRQNALKVLPVADVWGVGRKLASKLQTLEIWNAWQLACLPVAFIRQHFNVCVSRTVLELLGNCCFDLTEQETRQRILSSRSFGRKVVDVQELEQSVAYHAAIACKKLRAQASYSSEAEVFFQYVSPRIDKKYETISVRVNFSMTQDTRAVIRALLPAVRTHFKSGVRYKKAGVILTAVEQIYRRQLDVFGVVENDGAEFMQFVDDVQSKVEESHLLWAAEGIEKPWKMRSVNRSPCYTTSWYDLVQVRC